MDGDGTQNGYDIELNKAINDAVDIPVIASGGVGKPKDILDVFKKTDVSAALAASIFHFNQYSLDSKCFTMGCLNYCKLKICY